MDELYVRTYSFTVYPKPYYVTNLLTKLQFQCFYSRKGATQLHPDPVRSACVRNQDLTRDKNHTKHFLIGAHYNYMVGIGIEYREDRRDKRE